MANHTVRCASMIADRLSEPTPQQHGDDDEAHRDLVGHHLRRRAQRTQEGITRVGGPAGHDDAIDTERGDREQVQDADIDIGEREPGADRDHRPRNEAEDEGQHRRSEEHDLVGAGRQDGFLEEQLDGVGEGLQEAEGADHVGAHPQVHGRHNLALEIGEVGDGEQQRHQNGQDLRDDNDRRKGRSRPRNQPWVPVEGRSSTT